MGLFEGRRSFGARDGAGAAMSGYDLGFDFKRDPDAILKQVSELESEEGETRGKLKIFFGYAAGVGKTYAMLEEAHDAVKRGLDVVVGYVEPHTRAETTALVSGLEYLPPKDVEHRGITLKEFDLDAALERHPQIILVDELAHTNAPGCRHKKRFQDIEELLRAGISVFTTVNVQHLEGLNDKIAAITHVVVNERIPDRVFDAADSVELIDIEPLDLIDRLKAGKIYVPDRVNAALSNFFSQKNLAALREVALRRMADRLTRRHEMSGAPAHTEAGEEVLVYVTPDQGNVKAIRAAANLAESLHGTLTALVVRPSEHNPLEDQDADRLHRNVALAEGLGAHVVTLYGDDVPRLIAQYCVSAGVTQLVVGAGGNTRRTVRTHDALLSALTRMPHGAMVVAVPTGDAPVRLRRRIPLTGFKFSWEDVARAAVSVIAATALGFLVEALGFGSQVIPMIYLLTALLMATRADGFFYAAFAALGSVLAYNFFFTAPRLTFHAYGVYSSIMFAFLLIGTLVASTLTIRTKRQSDASARRAYRTEVLLESSRMLQTSTTVSGCLETAAGQIMKILDKPVVMYRRKADGNLTAPRVFDVPGSGGGDASAKELVAPSEVAVAAWVASNNERAGATTDTLLDAKCLYLPVASKDQVIGVAGLVVGDEPDDFGEFEKNLLIAILDECGQAAGQVLLAQERHEMRVKAEKETLRSNLLRMISHDLRTPLTSISGDADVLLQQGDKLTDEQKTQMYQDIFDDSTWLIGLVENLLSVTRIEDGRMSIKMQPEMLSEIIHDAMQHVSRRTGGRVVKADVADDMLMAEMDSRLIAQVLVNLVNNAITYTPEGSTIVVGAKGIVERGKKKVRVFVSDDGRGIPDTDKPRIFDMFYRVPDEKRSDKSADSRRGMGLGLPLCRSIVGVHGSELKVGDAEPHGCMFYFDLDAVDVAAIEAPGDDGSALQANV